MANKRMFSNAIVNSSRFLRMGQTARLLYYDLGMQADDSGVVEAFTVMRMTGASEDDLRVLAAKGFVIVLNDELVSYIRDWETHNNIRSDRKQPSVYDNLLVRVLRGDELPYLSADSQMSVSCQTNDSQLSVKCPHRLDKESIDKIRGGEEQAGDAAPSQSEPKQSCHKYGQYQNVLLSDFDLEQLCTEFPSDFQARIDRLSEYLATSGKSYKNHLATIRAWARRDAEKKQEKQKAAAPEPVYDLSFLEE